MRRGERGLPWEQGRIVTLYVLVLLVVGAPRSATITMTISGLTPLKVVDIESECEINAESSSCTNNYFSFISR